MRDRQSRSRHCVILCPPWPRSGSSSIFAAQTLSYLNLGFDVSVVAVPHDSTHAVDKTGFWRLVSADFKFDPRQSLFLSRSNERARSFSSRSYWSWLKAGRDSALAIESRIAGRSGLDPAFVQRIHSSGIGVLHVNHCVNMRLAQRIRALSVERRNKAPPILLDTHDVQADRYESCEIINPFLGRPDEPTSLACDELALSRGATALIHLAKRDHQRFQGLLPSKPHFLLRPTSRHELSTINVSRPDAPIDFLYLGNGHRANVRSVEWFLLQVAPRLDLSRIQVRIAGAVADSFRDRAPCGLTTYPNLWMTERRTVTDLYDATRFVIVPMTRGSGVSIKLVEALAMGKFVIASPAAIAGLEAIEGLTEAVTIAGSGEDFAQAMTHMASQRHTLNHKGRVLYERYLSNSQYAKSLAAIVANVLACEGGS